MSANIKLNNERVEGVENVNFTDADDESQIVSFSLGSGAGGTVTSITAGDGLTGGTITESGTIALDTNYTATSSRNGLMSSSDKDTLDGLDDFMKQFLLTYVMTPGYIYMTENSSFNPNTEWGGTWEKIEGRMLIGANSTYTIGSTGGSNTSSGSGNLTSDGPSTNTSGGPSTNTSGSTAITTAQMPSHTHGNKSLTGSVQNVLIDDGAALVLAGICGAESASRVRSWAGSDGNAMRKLTFNASHEHSSVGSGSGHTHTLSSHTHTLSSHTHTTSSHTHTLTPPYEAVNIWKRIS